MPRLLPLALLIANLAVLGGALAFQYLGRLAPCELCLYERWPYDAAAVLALLALVRGGRRFSRIALVLAGLIFLAGAGLAFYHVGVERHWFAGPAACTAPALNAKSEAALEAQLLATPVVRCDQIPWSLFGISLAGWNLAASVLLALCCGFAQVRLRRIA
jgi:disulfide bond formation protein DsbB